MNKSKRWLLRPYSADANNRNSVGGILGPIGSALAQSDVPGAGGLPGQLFGQKEIH